MSTPHVSRPKRPLLSVSRIALLVLLAAASGAWIVDRQARAAAHAAYDKLQSMLGDEKTIPTVTREQVRQVMGREPDEDDDPADPFEVYSWQGVPRKQTVQVVYSPGKPAMVESVKLNQAER